MDEYEPGEPEVPQTLLEYNLKKLKEWALKERTEKPKEKIELKKRTVPTSENFDGWETAEYILENIMYRKYWAVEDRDALAEVIESTVARENERYECHFIALAEVENNNNKILDEAKKERKKKRANIYIKSKQEKKNV